MVLDSIDICAVFAAGLLGQLCGLCIVWLFVSSCEVRLEQVSAEPAPPSPDRHTNTSQPSPPASQTKVLTELRMLDLALSAEPRGKFGGQTLSKEGLLLGTAYLIVRPAWTLVSFDAEQTPDVIASLKDDPSLVPFTAFWWPARDKMGLGFVRPPTTGPLAAMEHTTFARQRWVHLRSNADLTVKAAHGLLPAIKTATADWVHKISRERTGAPLLVASYLGGIEGTVCMQPVCCE